LLNDLLSEIDLDYFRKKFIKYTRKAFQLLPKLKNPKILDICCGSGLPTIELAKLSDGEIVGVDIDGFQLSKLNRKIMGEGYANRVKAIKCSILKLDFPNESFDIIWAEGVIRILGFEKSLQEWNHFLRHEGYLVIHDAINMVSDKLEHISHWGYKLINYFLLPENIWWTEMYEPLEIQIKKLRKKYKDSNEALKILKKYQNEINLVKKNPEVHNSAFYIIQKKSLISK
jgi:ubiquinone/menaquinone biosynthesis C-methylase UbiE